MAPPSPSPSLPPSIADDIEEIDEEVEDEEEDDDEAEEEEPSPRADRAKLDDLVRRLSAAPVGLRVHDVIVRGNERTADSLIESEVVPLLKSASTMQELLRAASLASARLRRLDIFDSVNITLDAGPSELSDTANVVVDVVEAKQRPTGQVGVFSKPEARSWSLEGSMKYKNWFGYGDIWDASVAYGWDQISEVSAGVSLPRFKWLVTPIMARIALLSQDWTKFSSYQERLLGVSLGLFSTENHDLAYQLTWRTLTDPSSMASKSIRRQLGHSLLSALKYTYTLDKIDSHLRPTRGYAFISSSQVGGLGPDSKSLRFIRQEFGLRLAFPLGFYRSALNFGISAGIVLPWGKGFMNRPSSLPDRFFIGGNSSPVCSLGGPSTLLGFKCRGLGPSEPRRLIIDKSNESVTDPGRDALGGDIAMTAFADLSFDLPIKLLRESGIHGHTFFCAGNLTTLDQLKNSSVRSFAELFRSSCGIGIVVPTKLFRMEVNYCYILKQSQHDRGKTGIQFNFSPV